MGRGVPIIALIAALTAALPAAADDAGGDGAEGADYRTRVVEKFGRGFANAATGWLELPKSMVLESRAHNVLYGVTLGLLEGAAQSVGRSLVGVVELGTFFVPNPEIIHPRFVWAPWERKSRYGTR